MSSVLIRHTVQKPFRSVEGAERTLLGFSVQSAPVPGLNKARPIVGVAPFVALEHLDVYKKSIIAKR